MELVLSQDHPTSVGSRRVLRGLHNVSDLTKIIEVLAVCIFLYLATAGRSLTCYDATMFHFA